MITHAWLGDPSAWRLWKVSEKLSRVNPSFALKLCRWNYLETIECCARKTSQDLVTEGLIVWHRTQKLVTPDYAQCPRN